MSLLSQLRGFIFLFHKSYRSSSFKPLTACLYNYKPVKRYSQERKLRDESHEREERAPSTAQEFVRVAEEKQKLQLAGQGIANQTSDKLYDGVEEATIGDSNVDIVKKRSMEHEADYRKGGDET